MRSAEKQMMDYCTYCPKMCRFSCPVSEVTKSETFTPWGKMQVARWLLEKKIPFSEENVLPLYQCTNCLHCQEYCEHDNDVPRALEEVRKLAVENCVAPSPVFEMEKKFRRFNNPYGVKLDWDREEEFCQVHPHVVFFPSCHTRHFFPERLRTYFALFQKLKIPGIAIKEDLVPCCGEPLRALGLEKAFGEIAEIQGHSLRAATTVVTDGPECSATLKNHYGSHGLPKSGIVTHLLEFLEPYFEHSNYQTQGKVRGRFLFLDSPFLVRHQKLAELPRKFLTQLTGFKPMELAFHGEDALSAGVEGAYGFLFPETSEAMTRRILEEIQGRRIRKVITACSQLEEQLRRLDSTLEVQDLYEFLNEQILVP